MTEHETADVAIVEGQHDVVWVEGLDAVAFLDGLLSQDLQSMEMGAVSRAMLLQPQGKLRHLLWVARGEERVGLVVDGGRAARLADDLAHYKIRVKADIRVEDRPIVGVWGAGAGAVTEVASGWLDADDATLICLPSAALERVVVIGDVPVEGLPVASEQFVTAVRAVAGEPVMGRDVDESTIPQETGLVSESVSFTKGCYLGQELVARIDTRGHVNRRLCGLLVRSSEAPPEGAPVWYGDREVGAVTSVAESTAVGAPVGMCLLRREVDLGETVEVRWSTGAAPAVVCSFPIEG